MPWRLWNCLKAVRRSAEIQTSPVWKNLAVYGNAEQLSQQIEAELQPAMIRKYGKLQIAQQWMVRRKTFSTWVSPIADLVWVYKKVTKHSVNFIPTGKTYSVVLVGRHRQRIEEQMKEKAVNEMLADLATRRPMGTLWLYQGPGKSLAKRPCRRDRGGGFALPAAKQQVCGGWRARAVSAHAGIGLLSLRKAPHLRGFPNLETSS